jgi:hypothetical protein
MLPIPGKSFEPAHWICGLYGFLQPTDAPLRPLMTFGATRPSTNQVPRSSHWRPLQRACVKPYGFVLRAVFVVYTWVCVPQECHVDFAVYASQAQPVHERVAERMKYLAAVSNAMCPYVAPKPLRERRLTRGARCYVWK